MALAHLRVVKRSVKSLRHGTRRHAPSKDTGSQLNDPILDGVTPVNDDLGRGTYGEVFTVRYVRRQGRCSIVWRC